MLLGLDVCIAHIKIDPYLMFVFFGLPLPCANRRHHIESVDRKLMLSHYKIGSGLYHEYPSSDELQHAHQPASFVADPSATYSRQPLCCGVGCTLHLGH